MDQRGVVLELKGNNAAVLTPEGEFVQVPVSPPLPEIGEEIRFQLPLVDQGNRLTAAKPTPGPRNRWFLAAAAVIFLFFISSLVIEQPWNVGAAVAYIGVDINPSIEMAINSREKVVGTKAYNADGKKLLSGIDLKGVPVAKALQLLTERSMAAGFLAPTKDNTIVITVASGRKGLDGAKLQKELKQSTEEYLRQKSLGATVSTIAVNDELRDASRKVGLSPGKYAILVESLDAGLQLGPEDLKEKGIATAIKMVGGNPEEIIGKAHAEQEFSHKVNRFRKVIEEDSKDTGENGELNEPGKGGKTHQKQSGMHNNKDGDEDNDSDQDGNNRKGNGHSPKLKVNNRSEGFGQGDDSDRGVGQEGTPQNDQEGRDDPDDQEGSGHKAHHGGTRQGDAD